MSLQQAAGPAAMPPPAWYADPYGQHALRYWDGARWTEHVHAGAPVRVQAAPSTSTEKKSSFWDKLEVAGALVAAAVFIVLVVVIPLGFGLVGGWIVTAITGSVPAGVATGVVVFGVAVMIARFQWWLDGIF